MNQPAPPCACTTVRKANRALFRFYEDAMAASGITVTQFAILRALARSGPTPLSELAEKLVMERTSLYRTIRPLVDSHAISLSEGENKRIKIAAITPAGHNLIEQALPHWQRAQDHVLSVIGEQRWQELASLLLSIPNMIGPNSDRY